MSNLATLPKIAGIALQALGAVAFIYALLADAGVSDISPLASLCFVVAGFGFTGNWPFGRFTADIAGGLLIAMAVVSLSGSAFGLPIGLSPLPVVLAGGLAVAGVASCLKRRSGYDWLVLTAGVIVALSGLFQIIELVVTFGEPAFAGTATVSIYAATGLALIGTSLVLHTDRRHFEIPLQAVLALMVAASLLPAFVFMASQSRTLNEQHLTNIRAEGSNAAEEAANVALVRLNQRVAVLRGLSAALLLPPSEGANDTLSKETTTLLHRQLSAAVGDDKGWISLTTAAGVQLVNTRRDDASTPRVGLNLPTGLKPLAGTVQISDLHTSTTRSDIQLVTISYPVAEHNLVLNWRMPVEEIADDLKRIAPEGWTYAIADRQGRLVARSRNAEQWVGKPVTPSAWAKASASESGSDKALTLEGFSVVTSWQRLPFGWTALVGVREDIVDAAGSAQTRRVTIGAAMMTVMGLVIATLGALLISRPLSRVSSGSQLDDNLPAPSQSARAVVREINQLALALRNTSREQRRATDSLAESEARLQRFVDQAPAAIAMFDRDMRYLAVSARWQNYFAPNGAALNGQLHYEALPTISDQWREYHKRGLAGEVLAADNDMFVGLDGRSQYLRWELRPWRVMDGTIGGITIMAEDVSDKAVSEIALRESEARLKAIVDTATDAIVVVNDKGAIVNFNPAAVKMFGYAKKEALGKNFGILSASAADDDALQALARGRFAGFGPGVEVTGARQDGTHVPLELSVAEWTVQGKRYFTGIMRDITARKERENHIRLVMRELSHRTKNALAVVQAMAWQTSRTTNDVSEFQEQFTQRVDGLARSIGLLVRSDWEGVAIQDLVESQLAPFLDDSDVRLKCTGPALVLKPNAAQDLGLVLHELATNASKYGALSSAQGNVVVTWEIGHEPLGKQPLSLVWKEVSGPVISVPTHTGFGSTLIRDMLAKTYRGKISMDFAPTGFVWSLEVDVDRVVTRDRLGEVGSAKTM